MSPPASAALEQQRTDVRELVRSLVAVLEATIGASVRRADARWEGCRSAYLETYASYRYAATVRLDAAADDLLERVASLADRAGLVLADQTEPDRLRGRHGDLELSFWALPPESQGALLLTVRAPCVEVPEDERDGWRDRREEHPDPLA